MLPPWCYNKSAESTAARFIRAAAAAQFHQSGFLRRFDEIPSLLQCVYPLIWRAASGDGAGFLRETAQRPCA